MEMTRNGTAARALRLLLAAALALGMVAPALGLAPDKAHAAQGATLTVGDKIHYDAYTTTWFEVDGQPAWCGNPSKLTPDAGTYEKSPLSTTSGRTEELAADIWFSYGSPGFDASLWPSQWYGGGSMTPDRYMALAHILMADTYSSDGNYAMFGCTEGFRDWVRWNVIGFGDDGSLINDDATGRKILRRAGEVPSNFEPFMLYTGSSTQVILSFTYHTTVKVSKSAAQSWAADDPDYTLAGAVYGIYRTRADAQADRSRLTTITTDASGAGESGSLGATRDTFYAKEVRASSGYVLDDSIYEVGPGNDYTFSSAEPPITVRLVLKKFDAETGHGSPQGDATLDGALYQASYKRGGATETVKGETVGATVVFEGIPLGDIEVREARSVRRLSARPRRPSPARHGGRRPGRLLCHRGAADARVRREPAAWRLHRRQGRCRALRARGRGVLELRPGRCDLRGRGVHGLQPLRQPRLVRREPRRQVPGIRGVRRGRCRHDHRHQLQRIARRLDGYHRSPGPSLRHLRGRGDEGPRRICTRGHLEPCRRDPRGRPVRPARRGRRHAERGRSRRRPGAEGRSCSSTRARPWEEPAIPPSMRRGTSVSSLEGIQFTVVNASEHGVMVEDTYRPTGAVVAVIETAWNSRKGTYTAQTASDALPYGTYTIAETATNDSYLLTDGEPRTFEVREDGKTVTCDREGDALLWRDQVVRHDAHLQKKGSILGSKLAHVPFLITNVTTGEAHVAVTDRNGMLNTSSEWRSRQDTVNANDKLLEEDYIDTSDVMENSGIWFGQGEDGSMAEPDDKLGALPFGEYRIQELRCEANEGYALWEDTFNVSRDTTATGFDIDLGTVDDQPIPKLATEATDAADGDHVLSPEGTVTVIDEVTYANLVPGRTYTVKGTLMDKATARPLIVNGSEVTSEKEFVPIAPFGYVKVEFTFDASALAGKEIVAFESLEHEGIEVAAHADIYDEGQTVKMEPNPEIGTIATDAADGDHEVSADSTVCIEDQVFYAGLVPGEGYALRGILMDKATGEPVLVDGSPVEGEVQFTPEKESGFTTVAFEFDGTGFEGTDIVVFETLYRNGETVFEHSDLDNANQTVRMTEPAPEIGTTATDADDGDREAVADDDVTIIDEVRYENLEPGREYVLTGTLIDKTTAAPIEMDGLPLTSMVAFTPTEPNGSVEVSFSFDGSELAGHRMVAFESLALDGDVVATHEDIEDEGQSVDLVEKPGPGNPKTSLAQTGDTNKILPLVCLAVVAALATTLAALREKRRNHTDDEAASEEKEEDSEEEDSKDE